MYQILKKQTLNANTKLMVIEAPHVARKAEPGQFIILRVSAEGERIPLTIADFDREKGSVTIIFQEVGATTMALGELNEGDCLHDFVGPLAVAALVNDQIDCVVIDQEPAKNYVAANSGLKILDTAYADEDYAIAIKKGNTELLDKVNGALKELEGDGTLQSIVDKYISADSAAQ